MVTRQRSMPEKVHVRINDLLTDASNPSKEISESWKALEEAHVLSQPWAGTHVRVHWAMLRLAHRSGDLGEAVGQIGRLLLAAPGSFSGRYPIGNTGRARISALKPMPISDDLLALLTVEKANGGSAQQQADSRITRPRKRRCRLRRAHPTESP